jgi:hypothetical protein
MTLSRNNRIETQYTPNFSTNFVVKEYLELFDQTGVSGDDTGNLITPNQYMDGCTLYAFDLTPDKCNGLHTHTPKPTGSLKLQYEFREPNTEQINLLIFASIPSAIIIDKDKNVNVVIGI